MLEAPPRVAPGGVVEGEGDESPPESLHGNVADFAPEIPPGFVPAKLAGEQLERAARERGRGIPGRLLRFSQTLTVTGLGPTRAPPTNTSAPAGSVSRVT